MFGRKLKEQLKMATEGLKIREKELKAMQEYVDEKINEIIKLERKVKQKNERIRELEAECEYLFNNLTPKKRELINADRAKK